MTKYEKIVVSAYTGVLMYDFKELQVKALGEAAQIVVAAVNWRADG